MKIRLTILIPLLLIVSVLFSSSLIFYWQTQSADESIRRDARHQLNLDITRLQNVLYNSMIEGDVASARLSLSVSAMDQSVKTLLLTDGESKILLANRYSWQGASVTQIKTFDSKIAAGVKVNNKPVFFYPADNNEILTVYSPVILKLENQSGYQLKKTGVLFAEYSIHGKLIAAYQNAIRLSTNFFLLMLLATIAVALLLHFLVSKRLAALTDASKSLAEGNMDVQVLISGQDELAVLAGSFNEMAQHIRSSFKSLEKAEHQLVNMNETLEHQVASRTALLSEAQRIAGMGNWVLYLNKKQVFWSDEIYRILALDENKEEASFNQLQQMIHPDDRVQFDAAYQKSLQSTEKQITEFRLIRADSSQCWVRCEMLALFDEDNKAYTIKGIIQDISERKLEKERHDVLEKQLQQTQKMESLGQLTGGIAHDFNNMLAAIIGFTELAQGLEVEDKSGKLNKYLDIIMQSSERAKDLVSQMLTFSRSLESMDHKEKLSLNAVIKETLSLLTPILPSSINLKLEMADGDYEILANNVMLGQVFMNLCVNARDAMQNSQGQITIKVLKEHFTAVVCNSCHNPVTGEFVKVGISDSGAGMSAAVIEHIFEPFFTTKNVGKGTGMGLAMVHGIMHKHGGHILVDSAVDGGTTFNLLFPALLRDEQKEGRVVIEHQQITQGQGERIVIVDDEVAITLFMEDYLSAKGYQVISMNDSRQALKYVMENIDNIDLLITDYTMPGITGMQLAIAILEKAPDFPVVMCTGYSDYIDEVEALENNLKGFLHKPIDMGKLLLYIKQYARRVQQSA
ncbi:MAG: response regulator [Gammaproteobacteria bacterium]|nr:response regulator [Gammaproteobacteria bacterium]